MNSDGCAWTIISADQAKYTFYEAMGPTADPPTPVPIIEQLHVNGGGETACIDITGKNFTSKLKVPFFLVKCCISLFQIGLVRRL